MVSYYNFKALSRVSYFYKFAQSILHHTKYITSRFVEYSRMQWILDMHYSLPSIACVPNNATPYTPLITIIVCYYYAILRHVSIAYEVLPDWLTIIWHDHIVYRSELELLTATMNYSQQLCCIVAAWTLIWRTNWMLVCNCI